MGLYRVIDRNGWFYWHTQMSAFVNLWSWVRQFPLRGFLPSPPGSVIGQRGVQDHEPVVAQVSSLMSFSLNHFVLPEV